ncbi:MAG: hypothetical protein LBT82_01940 [Oscillospiraceae bacterium]|jgi:hypothetical protein|nr:hypothetical protein [Oscillospiraceae bacterium]
MFIQKSTKTANIKKAVSFFIGLFLLSANCLNPLNSEVSAFSPTTRQLKNTERKHQMLLMKAKTKCCKSSMKYLREQCRFLIKVKEKKKTEQVSMLQELPEKLEQLHYKLFIKTKQK